MAGEEMPPCPRCAGAGVEKDGTVGEMQRSRCHAGHRTCIPRTGTPFVGHRWPQEAIVTTVRWYRRYRLSAAMSATCWLSAASTSPPGPSYWSVSAVLIGSEWLPAVLLVANRPTN